VIERRLTLSRPLSLRQTFGVLRNGAHDPCARFDAAGFWRATRTPDGPATMLLSDETDGHLRLRAWGDGAQWCADHLEDFAGERAVDLPIEDPFVEAIAHELPGLRIPRMHGLVELMIPVIIGQRVTTREAFGAYRRIVKVSSEPGPGPASAGVWLPPDPGALGGRPSWWFHRFGIERKRAEAVLRVCARRQAVERLTTLPVDEARKLLLTVPGIGLWTAGIVGLYGLGDHDSVIVGDYHFPNHVSWALAGEARGDDKRMLELLEPYRPQRGRVLRLLIAGCPGAPKFGPRYNPLPITQL
jgi:3-methyladenine DNA glycosylase/8-oxoguanine DNA glycosylase